MFQHRIYCIASKIADWVTAATTESSASIVEDRGAHLDHHPHVGIRIPFVADVRKLNVELDPLPGDRVAELIARTLNVPASVRERAMVAFGR